MIGTDGNKATGVKKIYVWRYINIYIYILYIYIYIYIFKEAINSY